MRQADGHLKCMLATTRHLDLEKFHRHLARRGGEVVPTTPREYKDLELLGLGLPLCFRHRPRRRYATFSGAQWFRL
jgi:hypothetical protein